MNFERRRSWPIVVRPDGQWQNSTMQKAKTGGSSSLKILSECSLTRHWKAEGWGWSVQEKQTTVTVPPSWVWDQMVKQRSIETAPALAGEPWRDLNT